MSYLPALKAGQKNHIKGKHFFRTPSSRQKGFISGQGGGWKNNKPFVSCIVWRIHPSCLGIYSRTETSKNPELRFTKFVQVVTLATWELMDCQKKTAVVSNPLIEHNSSWMLPAHETYPFSLARFRKHGAHLGKNIQKNWFGCDKRAAASSNHSHMYSSVYTIPFITLSHDRRRPRHRRHRRWVVLTVVVVVLATSPCRRHVVAMSSPCRRHVVAMSSPCCRHVVAMPSPCGRRVVAMSSQCRRDAVTMPWACRRHVVVMPSPFAPTKLATDPLVHTRNLCPQASRI